MDVLVRVLRVLGALLALNSAGLADTQPLSRRPEHNRDCKRLKQEWQQWQEGREEQQEPNSRAAV